MGAWLANWLPHITHCPIEGKTEDMHHKVRPAGSLVGHTSVVASNLLGTSNVYGYYGLLEFVQLGQIQGQGYSCHNGCTD